MLNYSWNFHVKFTYDRSSANMEENEYEMKVSRSRRRREYFKNKERLEFNAPLNDLKKE